MKKIILSIFILSIIPLIMSGCAATSGNIKSNNPEMSAILHRKIISFSDIKIINKLIDKHVSFTVADLRVLIRDYRGNVRKSVSNNTNLNHHFLPINAKIKRVRFLAQVVSKILKNYQNVYNNINAQGRHYQTALFIACRLGERPVINALLKDKKINVHITSLGHMINITDYTAGQEENGFPLWTVVSMFPVRAYELNFLGGKRYTIPRGLCKGYKDVVSSDGFLAYPESFYDDCDGNPTYISLYFNYTFEKWQMSGPIRSVY